MRRRSVLGNPLDRYPLSNCIDHASRASVHADANCELINCAGLAGIDGNGWPGSTPGRVGPNPVHRVISYSPFRAGLYAVTAVKSTVHRFDFRTNFGNQLTDGVADRRIRLAAETSTIRGSSMKDAVRAPTLAMRHRPLVPTHAPAPPCTAVPAAFPDRSAVPHP